MKACVYCSGNQKEERSPLLRLDIFNPLVSDRSDAKRHKKSWACTFMACLSVSIWLAHSLGCFRSFFQTGWHSVTSFFRERKLRLQERQTRASGVCVRALGCTLSLYNQSGCPPPAHYSLWMLSHLGAGWGRRVFRFRHSTQHTGPRLFV